tara:strand:+ start:54 stop:458 length:405 start_codon:yes stop_codon:yes gene_type:complete
MELKARKIKADDWDMLSDWWKGHNWPVPARDSLPENGSGGIIIEENNKPTIAGFIYQTNSKGCWLEYIISDPNYKKDRSNILDFLIKHAEKAAVILGFKYMLFIGKSKGIRKSMKNNGWIEDPEPSYENMKKIN